MDKAAQKSIEWQKANSPMAIGGDAFADMVDAYNVNPAFVAGYKEAEKDILEKIEKHIKATEFGLFVVSPGNDKQKTVLNVLNQLKKEINSL